MVDRYFSYFSHSSSYLFGFKIFSVGNSIHNPLDRNKSELRDKKVNLNNGDPFTIALLGVDSDAERNANGGGQRSDSIMVISMNPDKKNIRNSKYSKRYAS